MRKVFKWLVGISALLFCGALFLGALVYGILLNTLPNDNGNMELAGLEARVNVIFDKYAIPHIEAQSLPDAMHTLGFIHARDRLWQMEFLRRVGQGRLSEIVGDATINTDVFLRTLDMAGSAKHSYDKLQPKTKQALIAYAKGVNAFRQREKRLFEPTLGAEFMILGHTPEDWEPWNSVLILKVMGFSLSANMDREIQRLAMASKGFSPQEIDDLVSYSPRDKPSLLPDLRELYGFGPKGKPVEDASSDQDSNNKNKPEKEFVLAWPTGRSASNNWVISGDKTASGKPILANDPHLGLTAPSAFYLAHLSFIYEGVRHELIGETLPGIPMLITGRNSRIAWGPTTTNLDGQDLFVERINPDNDNQYLSENGWLEFVAEEIEVKISDKESVNFIKKSSRHGPVLPDDFRGLKKLLPDGHVASLKWTGLASDDTTLDTLMGNMFAKNVTEFLEGTKYAVSPMQSLVVGDVEGNIALATPGRMPLRGDKNLIKGRAPVLGWEPKYEWKGYLQADQMPNYVNPKAGAFATANANFLPSDYPHHITYDWSEHFRQTRAEELVLKTNEKHDVERSKQIMADDYSQPLFQLVKIAAKAEMGGAGEKGDVFQALLNWDGRMNSQRPEPLIMLVWFKHLHEIILQDDLGDEYSLFDRGRITKILHILGRGTARDWCDKLDTEIKESCNDILLESFENTLTELKLAHGKDWQKWQYGKAHVAHSEHRPFGKVNPLSNFFNITVESGGGPYTLHRGQTDFGEEEPYRNRHGAAYRAIYDFDDLEQSIFIQSTGQSGNLMSQHYRDFAKLWSRSKFIKMTTDKTLYSQNAKGIWAFKP